MHNSGQVLDNERATIRVTQITDDLGIEKTCLDACSTELRKTQKSEEFSFQPLLLAYDYHAADSTAIKIGNAVLKVSLRKASQTEAIP